MADVEVDDNAARNCRTNAEPTRPVPPRTNTFTIDFDIAHERARAVTREAHCDEAPVFEARLNRGMSRRHTATCWHVV
jgi:hypothetical protein